MVMVQYVGYMIFGDLKLTTFGRCYGHLKDEKWGFWYLLVLVVSTLLRLEQSGCGMTDGSCDFNVA